jgi:ribosomal RNA-processing protein 8
METMEYLLDDELDYEEYEDCENNEEMLMNIAEKKDVCIEIHTNSLENPVERYNSKCESGDVVRVYKSIDEDTEEEIYCPIIKKDASTRRNKGLINGPKRENRMNVKVHTNPDVKVLWNITNDIDLTKDICSCIIDCEVVKYDPMEAALGIVERAKEREANDGNLLPRRTKLFDQENKDGQRLSDFKKALKGQKGGTKCSDEVRDYLDEHLPNWRLEQDEKAIEYAIGIVERANERIKKELNLFPRKINKEDRITPELKQANKDAQKLGDWKKALKGIGQGKCPDKVRDYLDEQLSNWRTGNTEKWNNLLEELKIFIIDNKRRPSGSSINNTEKTLGSWVCNQLTIYKNKSQIMNDKNVYDLFTKFLEEYSVYFKSKDMKWFENLLNLKSFIKTNKKRPSEDSKIKYERTLGKWLSHQLQNYKNKTEGMKDTEKYKLWSQFLEEYKEYFKQYFDTQSVSSKPAVIQTIKEEDDKEEIYIIPKPKKSMKLAKQSQSKKELIEQHRQRTKSEISQLHKEYKTLKSENLGKKFKEQPDLWRKYHEISEENEKSFLEDGIPRNRIIQELDKIKTKRTKLVVDMGCGKGQISQHFQNDKRFQFINYDHVSLNDTVISCDISNTPLDEDTVEICILSLAMWGSNCKQYVIEAQRILESNGKLYIIEPTKRWSEKDEAGNIIKEGSRLKELLEENGFKIVEQSIEKFCMFCCIKV